MPWDTLGPRAPDQGGGRGEPEGNKEGERTAEPVFRVPENQSEQEVVVPSDTGQPSARSSCGSAGPPGTPLWSPHAPWPAAGHTHPSAPLVSIPPGPSGLCPSSPGSQAWYSPSGSYLLAVQPLVCPQGSPSVAVEQWPSGLLVGPLGCCCWWRSWPWGLGQPGAWVEQWQWGQQGLGCWVGATGAQAGGPALQGSGPHAGSAGSAPGRVGAQAAGSSGCC